MSAEFDVIVVGSGPAGVSAAFPLVAAGLKVLMVDGGRVAELERPEKSLLQLRAVQEDQWKWMIGEDFYYLIQKDAVSPKLRVPTLRFVFDGFEAANNIDVSDFVSIGSMSAGGLSNAWGCGVAALSEREMKAYPFGLIDLIASYERVARRMGISGANQDDLVDYFGLDAWADAPLPLDSLQSRLLERYTRRRGSVASWFKMGRSRVAALSLARGERLACDQSGGCLWGCRRRSLYSAAEDLLSLSSYSNFTYWPGFVVDEIGSMSPFAFIRGTQSLKKNGPEQIFASRIVLAAGTLASTRLVAKALKLYDPIALQSCPVAAFLLWVPACLGLDRSASFGLGQLSFVLDLNDGSIGFGSLFNTNGIPMAEFSRFLPLRRRIGVDVLSWLMSSCAVGNLFLPGANMRAFARLNVNGSLQVKGSYEDSTFAVFKDAERKLFLKFLSLGAILLPGSFQIGRPGSDIHYSSSIPMRNAPKIGESNQEGEIYGLAGIHIADAAALSALSEKSHTLTVMANADRIGQIISTRLRSPS